MGTHEARINGRYTTPRAVTQEWKFAIDFDGLLKANGNVVDLILYHGWLSPLQLDHSAGECKCR